MINYNFIRMFAPMMAINFSASSKENNAKMGDKSSMPRFGMIRRNGAMIGSDSCITNNTRGCDTLNNMIAQLATTDPRMI